MPFVKRNETGAITSIHAVNTDSTCEDVPGDDPALVEFLKANTVKSVDAADFQRLDLDFIRVIEDVIYLMIEKRLITLTDLPVAAQRKLAERRNLRGHAGDLSGIVGDDEELLIP